MSSAKLTGHRLWEWAATNDAGRVIGEKHWSSKLSDADVALILDLREAGLSYRQIAAKFDDAPTVSKSMVALICKARKRQQTVMGHRKVPVHSSAESLP